MSDEDAKHRVAKITTPTKVADGTRLVARRSALDARPTASPRAQAARRFRRNRAAMAAAGFLVLALLFILVWPALAPQDANVTSDAQLQAPDRQHWFGTDVHGRDLLVRVCVGGQVSLLVGLGGALVSLLIGVSWGAVAGYVGGRLDAVMMRVVDGLYALPSIILVMLLVAIAEGPVRSWTARVFGTDARLAVRVLFLCAGLGSVSWLTMARIVRGQVLSLKQRPFVEASRALGANHVRILWRHILPNVSGVIIIYLMLTVPAVVLYESFLSYLGLGIQPPMASWGSLMAEGAQELNPIRIYWWLLVFPATTLVATLLALNLLGDGLRDALDPRALP